MWVMVRPEYVYAKTSRDAVTWGPGGDTSDESAAITAYPTPNRSALFSQFRAAFGQAGLGPWGVEPAEIGFKYGKFSPAGDFVVTTLYASAPGGPNASARHLLSRVILVRRADGRIWDMTSLVEAFEGASAGSWSAFAPTCASPP